MEVTRDDVLLPNLPDGAAVLSKSSAIDSHIIIGNTDMLENDNFMYGSA